MTIRTLLPLATLLVLSTPLFAQGAPETSPVEFAAEADSLKPGEWVWAPEIAPEGPVTVFVDLTKQTATVYRNGLRIGVTTVSTGKPGHETPTGVFTILQKDADHRSSLYNNAPMFYQQRLTWDGVALHAGGLPGYPESHGCVHLPIEFAKLLFDVTDFGGTVVVAGRAGSTLHTHGGGVLAGSTHPDSLSHHVFFEGDGNYQWEPENAPEGPVSIVGSLADQEVVVLRNGVEIGRAPAQFPLTDFATHVLTLTRDEAGRYHWSFVDVPGHEGEAAFTLDASVAGQLRMPRGFVRHLGSILEPGVTVLITRAPLREDTTGPVLTVLSGAADAAAEGEER